MLIKFILKNKNSKIFQWVQKNQTASIIIVSLFASVMVFGFMIILVIKAMK